MLVHKRHRMVVVIAAAAAASPIDITLSARACQRPPAPLPLESRVYFSGFSASNIVIPTRSVHAGLPLVFSKS